MTNPQLQHRQYSAVSRPNASNCFEKKKLIGERQIRHFIASAGWSVASPASIYSFHPAYRNRRIAKHFDTRLDLLENHAPGTNKGPCSNLDARDYAGMTSKKYSFTKADIPIDATMAADLAPISNSRIMSRVAMRSNRNKIAHLGVTGHRGKRSYNNPGSELNILPDIRPRVNYIDEMPPSFQYRRIVPNFVLWISYGTNEYVVFFDSITLHVPKYSRLVTESIQRVYSVVKKSLDLPGRPMGNRLGGPRECFAAKFAGADDNETLFHNEHVS